MAEYQSLATDYLFIGLLPLNQSLKVTEGLDISATDYLDINKMDIVARIDLSSYETDKESKRYLSYIKGRVGRKVADFFLDFLQADIGLDTKQQNQVLMQAVEDFCADAKFEKEEVISYKSRCMSTVTIKSKRVMKSECKSSPASCLRVMRASTSSISLVNKAIS